MIYGSVCSGIEAATAAWHPLGWKPAFFSEIDKAPRAVLQHHYPDVPLHADFTTIKEQTYGAINLIVGGTPCQDFSVAGLRAGLLGARGNLTVSFLAMVKREKPQWVVWENVPGILSIDGGRAFSAFLGGLAQLGYGFAYRVLDAQYFGVPQRRKRVFVVANLGNWQRAAAVLFERESLRGDITPCRAPRQDTAPTLDARAGRSGETTFATSGGLVPYIPEIAACLETTCHDYSRADGFNRIAQPATFVAALGHTKSNGLGVEETETARTLEATASCNQAVAFDWYSSESQHMPVTDGFSPPLKTTMQPAVLSNMQVRRFIPLECERLQGFADNYTLVPYGKGMMPDSLRYKMLGNSMARPVMEWIGQRIELINSLR